MQSDLKAHFLQKIDSCLQPRGLNVNNKAKLLSIEYEIVPKDRPVLVLILVLKCDLFIMVINMNFKVVSSPEHEVLMVSFCDRPMSVVRRVKSVIHNFFKHLLLLNHRANLDETWQGCSLGEVLPKLFKRLNSSH